MLMSFPNNAHQGVKKIFAAGVLALIALCIEIVALVLAFTKGIFALNFIETLGWLSLILSVTSLVVELVGVNQAAKDEQTFRSARIALIVSTVFALLNFFVEEPKFLVRLFSLTSNIASYCLCLFIIRAVINLAHKLKNQKVAELGIRLFRLCIIAFCYGFTLGLLLFFIEETYSARTLLFVLSIAACLVSIVQIVLYFLCLSRAIKMLDVVHNGWGYDQSAPQN